MILRRTHLETFHNDGPASDLRMEEHYLACITIGTHMYNQREPVDVRPLGRKIRTRKSQSFHVSIWFHELSGAKRNKSLEIPSDQSSRLIIFHLDGRIMIVWILMMSVKQRGRKEFLTCPLNPYLTFGCGLDVNWFFSQCFYIHMMDEIGYKILGWMKKGIEIEIAN